MNGDEVRTSNDEGRIIYGLLLCWGLNIVQLVIGSFAAALATHSENFIAAFVIVGGIGLLQLVYVLPLYFRFRKQDKSETTKGLVIAASITALLNATCWGLFAGH
jgi:hypothetical protein